MEDEEEEAEHIEGGEAAGDEADGEDEVVAALEGGEEDLVFREEAGEREDAGDGEAGDEGRAVGPGEARAEAAHVFDEVAVDGVDGDTGGEEEHALEEGVGEDVEHGGGVADGVEGAGMFAAADGVDDAEGEEHVTELGEGGEGEDALDVVLGAGDDGGEEGGEGAEEGDEFEGVGGVGE